MSSFTQLAQYLTLLLNTFMKHVSILQICYHCSIMKTTSIISEQKFGVELFQKIREYSYKLCH